MHVNIQVESRAENIFTEKTFSAGLLDGVPDDLGRFRKFATDVDVGKMDVRGEGRNDETFDELVGILVQDVAILERASRCRCLYLR